MKIVKSKYFLIVSFFAVAMPSFFYLSGDIQYKKVILDESVEIKAEVADSFWETTKGLGGRDFLPEEEGMLFVFPEDSKKSFWMKGMKFSLDIIWINDGKIIDINKNAPFDDQKKVYYPDAVIDYVLEVNAGFSDKNNIEVGDTFEVISE